MIVTITPGEITYDPKERLYSAKIEVQMGGTFRDMTLIRAKPIDMEEEIRSIMRHIQIESEGEKDD